MGRLSPFPKHSEVSSTTACTGEGVGPDCGVLIAGSAGPMTEEALGTEEEGN